MNWCCSSPDPVFSPLYFVSASTLFGFGPWAPRTRQASLCVASSLCLFLQNNIAKIRPVLSFHNSEIVLHALVSCRLIKCATRSLQLIQNRAARILTRTNRYSHITPVLASLHLLPIQARADFKVLLLTFKPLNGLAPAYLSDLLTPYILPRSLRSLNSHLCVIPSVNKETAGCRAFFLYSASYLWNGLPLCIYSVFRFGLLANCLCIVLFFFSFVLVHLILL